MITIIALIGALLIAGSKWQGFLCWLVSNAYWAWHNATIGEYEQAILFAVFWLISLWSVFIWRFAERKRAGYIESYKDYAASMNNQARVLARMVIDAKRQLDDGTERVKINDLVKCAKKILNERRTQ